MAGNSPDDPRREAFGPEDEAHREPQPIGQLRGDKPPPCVTEPPRGELYGTDKPPPAEPPPDD